MADKKPETALAVIDLSKIKYPKLDRLATGDAPVFHEIPIAALLVILLSRGPIIHRKFPFE